QAEDGIRDDLVTGVQTCALPISAFVRTALEDLGQGGRDFVHERSPVGRDEAVEVHEPADPIWNLLGDGGNEISAPAVAQQDEVRSEERRVGKERRSRGAEGTDNK